MGPPTSRRQFLKTTTAAGLLGFGVNSTAGDASRTSGEFVFRAGGRMRAPAADLGSTYSVELWIRNGMPADARPVAGYFFSRGIDNPGWLRRGPPCKILPISRTARARP